MIRYNIYACILSLKYIYFHIVYLFWYSVVFIIVLVIVDHFLYTITFALHHYTYSLLFEFEQNMFIDATFNSFSATVNTSQTSRKHHQTFFFISLKFWTFANNYTLKINNNLYLKSKANKEVYSISCWGFHKFRLVSHCWIRTRDRMGKGNAVFRHSIRIQTYKIMSGFHSI